MRSKIWILAAALCFGLCAAMLHPKQKSIAQAKGTPAVLAEEQGKMRGPASRGNIVYRDGGKEAGIYTSDFFLLYEKLSMISGEIFDPACYTHTHQWEYRDVDGHSHTRHCAICGDAFDLVGAHKADCEEDCTISYGGKEFPGRCYRCICGYQWKVEKAHTLTFDVMDETRHRSRCLLDGTEYCLGYEPVEEEHYAFHHTPNQEGTHYIKTCIDCGYQTEEAYEPEESSEEPAQSESEETVVEEPAVSEQEKTEPSQKTTTPEPDRQPEISVSGNDCSVNATRGKAAEETEEMVDERGERL